jgi:acyl-coenzyme A thioesterase PaaI-like protein
MGQPIPLATLDLRIDYLRPSTPGHSVRAKVECYKQTHNIAFARGVAFESDEADPIASMAATYMLRTQSKRDPASERV